MPIQITHKNQEYQRNVFMTTYPSKTAICGFSEEPLNVNDEEFPVEVSSHGNFEGSLKNKVLQSVNKFGHDKTFLYKVSISEAIDIVSYLAELSEPAHTPQRAKKAPQKKRLGVNKAPKAAPKAKTSRNPSEKVTVSTRITRTQILSSPSNNSIKPLLHLSY